MQTKAAVMKGGTIIIIFSDRGDRYLTTALFTAVCAKCPP
jgi:hypothetical protein